MNIKISSIVDTKNLDKERIVFKVIEDDFLGAYQVYKSKKIGEKGVSSKLDNVYWFPDKEVKKGDLVVLYTKVGVNTEKKNEDATSTYFFYWQMNATLWNNSNEVVVLSRLQNWDFETVAEK